VCNSRTQEAAPTTARGRIHKTSRGSVDNSPGGKPSTSITTTITTATEPFGLLLLLLLVCSNSPCSCGSPGPHCCNHTPPPAVHGELLVVAVVVLSLASCSFLRLLLLHGSAQALDNDPSFWALRASARAADLATQSDAIVNWSKYHGQIAKANPKNTPAKPFSPKKTSKYGFGEEYGFFFFFL